MKPELHEGETALSAFRRGAIDSRQFLDVVRKREAIQNKLDAEYEAEERQLAEAVWLASFSAHAESVPPASARLFARLLKLADDSVGEHKWRMLLVWPWLLTLALIAVVAFLGLAVYGFSLRLVPLLHEQLFGTYWAYKKRSHWLSHVGMCVVICILVHALFVLAGIEHLLENLL